MPLSSARLAGPFDCERVAAFLDESVIPLRLAVVAPSGWPVVVSLWFARDGEHLLCATQESSPVVKALAREPRCAFEVAGCEPPYRGVRGRARVAVEPDTGLATLRGLVERYLGGAGGQSGGREPARAVGPTLSSDSRGAAARPVNPDAPGAGRAGRPSA